MKKKYTRRSYIEDSYSISDSFDIDSFANSFEPYVISESYESDEDYYDQAERYRYDDDEDDYINRQKNIYLELGDKNSDTVLNITVYNISIYGEFEFEIEDSNLSYEEEKLLYYNDKVNDTITDFIAYNIVFDETH